MSGDNKIWIFDTTLRDGEQALRASLSQKQKIQLAHAIARLNVDVMEVGFPVSSPGDFNSVQQIAREVKGPIICGLARAVSGDIEACGQALQHAERRRIHTFIATSPLHLQYKLRKTLAQASDQAVAAIKLASRYTDDIEFSCEDAGRTPIDDLCWIVERAIAAGATTINIPDTVGYTVPNEFSAIISALKNRVPNMDKARLSVHCHNDLGLAVANSVSAIQAGARQIECTVNGIGERAGNCSLEEVAMIINTRKDIFMPLYTDIKTTEIYRSSHLVSQICNMPIQPNKAIVGENAFAHSSGIHQDGVLKAQNTYEIMSPEQVGIRQNELNLTSRSGRHVIQHRLAELGYTKDDYDLDAVYQSFVALADEKGRVFDYDLEALVFFQTLQEQNDYYVLDFLSSSTNTGQVASATVGLKCDGVLITEAATGNGPVEAAFNAITRISKLQIKMVDFNLQAKGSGESALGQVDITAEHEGRRFHGAGLATDIVRSSVLAYIHVLNMIQRAQTIDAHKHSRNGAEATAVGAI
ncbi:2-isopropylmalate synthase [Rheinheimera salexigens]|uniref:2-isopropylmalate synthase n=1 Tax=Rheinheimera salexigens TaxID=1628148 RepID=A0A1E7Q2R8_9GAMM|nr:2-isopropylmalate synthase [Rheinheimera salexigens]OEY68482.1 2-isopropylmalate synthase [Rheinheimera salexigens]